MFELSALRNTKIDLVSGKLCLQLDWRLKKGQHVVLIFFFEEFEASDEKAAVKILYNQLFTSITCCRPVWRNVGNCWCVPAVLSKLTLRSTAGWNQRIFMDYDVRATTSGNLWKWKYYALIDFFVLGVIRVIYHCICFDMLM